MRGGAAKGERSGNSVNLSLSGEEKKKIRAAEKGREDLSLNLRRSRRPAPVSGGQNKALCVRSVGEREFGWQEGPGL